MSYSPLFSWAASSTNSSEISKATFGMTPSEYKKHKNLKNENLRDHMTDLELIFSLLGKTATKEIAINKNAQGFIENKDLAKREGTIAGEARRKLKQESRKSVISKENYLDKLIQTETKNSPIELVHKDENDTSNT